MAENERTYCVATYYEGQDEPNLECVLVPNHDGLHFDCKRSIQWRGTNEPASAPIITSTITPSPMGPINTVSVTLPEQERAQHGPRRATDDKVPLPDESNLRMWRDAEGDFVVVFTQPNAFTGLSAFGPTRAEALEELSVAVRLAEEVMSESAGARTPVPALKCRQITDLPPSYTGDGPTYCENERPCPKHARTPVPAKEPEHDEWCAIGQRSGYGVQIMECDCKTPPSVPAAKEETAKRLIDNARWNTRHARAIERLGTHGEHAGDIAAIIARNAELEAQTASAFLRGQESMRERIADVAYSEPVRRELILKMPLIGEPASVPTADQLLQEKESRNENDEASRVHSGNRNRGEADGRGDDVTGSSVPRSVHVHANAGGASDGHSSRPNAADQPVRETEPTRWRKKPVVIDAWLLTETNGGAIAEWCGGVFRGGPSGGSRGGSVLIHTLEGDHRADVGDYIIRGVKGEFYPCKPDIFAATYEPAAAASNPSAPKNAQESKCQCIHEEHGNGGCQNITNMHQFCGPCQASGNAFRAAAPASEEGITPGAARRIQKALDDYAHGPITPTLSASEAVYAFAAWLTARNTRTVASSHDDAAPIAALVAEFCDGNGLAPPREHWWRNYSTLDKSFRRPKEPSNG